MIRKLIGLGLFVGLTYFVAAAQETPKPEVFGGYEFTSLDSGWHGNGWNGAANLYITRWFGVNGDLAGVYGTSSSFTTYTFGPVVSTHKSKISPFAHALFGGAHASSYGVGDNGMAMLFGGGVDLGNQKLAFRVGQLDWMMTRFNGYTDKNNMRFSTGALFRF